MLTTARFLDMEVVLAQQVDRAPEICQVSTELFELWCKSEASKAVGFRLWGTYAPGYLQPVLSMDRLRLKLSLRPWFVLPQKGREPTRGQRRYFW